MGQGLGWLPACSLPYRAALASWLASLVLPLKLCHKADQASRWVCLTGVSGLSASFTTWTQEGVFRLHGTTGPLGSDARVCNSASCRDPAPPATECSSLTSLPPHVTALRACWKGNRARQACHSDKCSSKLGLPALGPSQVVKSPFMDLQATTSHRAKRGKVAQQDRMASGQCEMTPSCPEEPCLMFEHRQQHQQQQSESFVMERASSLQPLPKAAGLLVGRPLRRPIARPPWRVNRRHAGSSGTAGAWSAPRNFSCGAFAMWP